MAERIEFVGNPLPTGLPGFGGGTISVLVLPGFNTVVAAQQFGPVVDAPTVTPPNPEPPAGSDPEDPTNEVVPPAPAPPSGSGFSSNFCENCVPPKNDVLVQPLYFGKEVESGCTGCTGFQPGTILAPVITMSNDRESYVRYYEKDKIGGLDGDPQFSWTLDHAELLFGEDGTTGMSLTKDALVMEGTEYRTGAVIFDVDTSRTYEGRELQVCVGGTTKTWYVLAHEV
jgi:hypothetical protein